MCEINATITASNAVMKDKANKFGSKGWVIKYQSFNILFDLIDGNGLQSTIMKREFWRFIRIILIASEKVRECEGLCQ